MKFQKSVIAFAVATAMMGASVSAQAGTASFTFNTYANEMLASTAVTVNSPVMAFTAAPGATISAGTKATVFVDLGASGLKFSGAAAPALTVYSNGGAVTATVTPVAIPAGGSSFVAYVIDNTVAGAVPLNNLTFQFAQGTNNLTVPTTFINATGNATYSIFNGDLSGSTSVPTSGAADSATGQVIATTQAVTATVKASNGFDSTLLAGAPAGVTTEYGKIDVLSTPAAGKVYGGYFTTTAFATSTSLIDLGGMYLTVKPGVLNASGVQFALGTDNGDLKFNVAGNFVVSSPAGNSNLFLSGTNTCAAPIAAPVTITATNSSSVPLVLPKANTNANAYVCYTVDGTAPIPVTTPSVSGLTLLDSGNTYTIDSFANANLYPLVQNGSTVTVYNYVPASTSGYAYNVRISAAGGGVTNAPVTGQLIDDTGAVVASGTLVSSLGAGKSANLNSTQIESALNATGLTAGKAYKLVITAAVGQINVQSFLINLSTGAFTNLSASQAGAGNGFGSTGVNNITQ